MRGDTPTTTVLFQDPGCLEYSRVKRQPPRYRDITIPVTGTPFKAWGNIILVHFELNMFIIDVVTKETTGILNFLCNLFEAGTYPLWS